MALTTVDAVKAEGSFYKEQFNLDTDLAMEGVLTDRIAEAAAEVEAMVGADLYGTSETAIVTKLTTAETYLATAKAFQTVLNIMATWDAEALPTEFVDREELPEIVGRYRAMAMDLLRPHLDGVRSGARPYLAGRSIAVDDD